MRKALAVSALILAVVLTGWTATTGPDFQKSLPTERQILHALDRLSYGPRPGDVEAVRRMGLQKWMEQQLHPEKIAEDKALAVKLASLDSLRMTPAELVENYPPPQLLRAIAEGRRAYPHNPLLRAAIERVARRLKVRDGDPRAQLPEERIRNAQPLTAVLKPAEVRALRNGTPEEQRAVLQSIPEDKLDDVAVALPQRLRQEVMANADPATRRKMVIAAAPGQVPAFDLTEAKLYRAVYSNRQLEEQMVDFWFNHFNVYLDKGADRFFTTGFERDAIRPHVFGKFRDLLGAVAESPAMMFYLDNWQSSIADADRGMIGRFVANQLKGKQRARGLNENYARELMELHTLGVDGGYSQKDVTEIARCFTGWTIRQPNLGGAFFYNDRMHDKGEKVVLGVKIPAGGGRGDAEKVLDILARHPSTARFVSTKLARKFVADEPPASLVERMAKTFRETDGDIRRVMETMISSPEFFSEGAWRAKVKTPLEMVVSAVRATGADVEYAGPLALRIAELGQPLYRKVEPTGYSSANSEWVNSAALLGRMNFGLDLAGNQVAGAKLDAARFSDSPREAARQILLREASRETIASMEKALANGKATVAGLVLGSPDFQRR